MGWRERDQEKGGSKGGDSPAAHHGFSERRATAKGTMLKDEKRAEAGGGWAGEGVFPDA